MTMKNLPFMPLYWGEYLGATAHLTTIQHGAYLLLIAFHWQNGKLPPGDDNLRRIAKLDPRQWRSVRPALEPFFEVETFQGVTENLSRQNRVWKHRRVMTELAQAIEKTTAKRDTYTSTHTKTEYGHNAYRRNGNGTRKSVQQAAREQLAELDREIAEAEKAERANSRH